MSGLGRDAGVPSPGDEGVTIITQTRVRPEAVEAFARWQDETSRVIAAFPGFIKQTVMPPSPPQQVDWVILQRFARRDDGDGVAQVRGPADSACRVRRPCSSAWTTSTSCTTEDRARGPPPSQR